MCCNLDPSNHNHDPNGHLYLESENKFRYQSDAQYESLKTSKPLDAVCLIDVRKAAGRKWSEKQIDKRLGTTQGVSSNLFAQPAQIAHLDWTIASDLSDPSTPLAGPSTTPRPPLQSSGTNAAEPINIDSDSDDSDLDDPLAVIVRQLRDNTKRKLPPSLLKTLRNEDLTVEALAQADQEQVKILRESTQLSLGQMLALQNYARTHLNPSM